MENKPPLGEIISKTKSSYVFLDFWVLCKRTWAVEARWFYSSVALQMVHVEG